ncbi:Helicase required for RNAi-mediated heterochromatin assembly 1 [Ceratocystis platani]|uniref:Helicase required for RNAi-mediated heterochromatin assembly 1 n=1 Tax=Ceratocystis fimbriata f. sp. platani TaxID=88771 RepID=A0A0F8AX60_CERFI|nr:Helicase required for RNAi-mediated heterochromatin assembly 1 [Ceratocystis platani]
MSKPELDTPGTPSWWRSEIPDKEEIISDYPILPLENDISELPESRESHAAIHYSLLRHEATELLRRSVSEYKTTPDMMDSMETKVYSKASISPLSDNFTSKVVVAVVTKRILEGGLLPGDDEHAFTAPRIDVSWRCEEDTKFMLDPDQELVMIQAGSSGLYEAVRHVMEGLKQWSKTPTKFDKFFISGNKHPHSAPLFDGDKSIINIESMVPPDIDFPDRNVDLSSPLPPEFSGASGLDPTQLLAFQMMLAKEISIVQGPPGTGKTFTSVSALKIILENLPRGDAILSETSFSLDWSEFPGLEYVESSANPLVDWLEGRFVETSARLDIPPEVEEDTNDDLDVPDPVEDVFAPQDQDDRKEVFIPVKFKYSVQTDKNVIESEALWRNVESAAKKHKDLYKITVPRRPWLYKLWLKKLAEAGRDSRRMTPMIRSLIDPFYKDLEDHEIVRCRTQRPLVPGMGGLETFWFHHEWPERLTGLKSRINVMEAKMLVGLFRHLIQNGTPPDRITVLTFYKGQVPIIRMLLEEDSGINALTSGPFHIFTVDGFQGEENDVILLSLVRSPLECGSWSIGFLDDFRRTVVALSRARRGLYIFGNFENFLHAKKAETAWLRTLEILMEQNRQGPALELICEKHGVKTCVTHPDDLARLDGGCEEKCKEVLIPPRQNFVRGSMQPSNVLRSPMHKDL